jgi:hypothetical protein
MAADAGNFHRRDFRIDNEMTRLSEDRHGQVQKVVIVQFHRDAHS